LATANPATAVAMMTAAVVWYVMIKTP